LTYGERLRELRAERRLSLRQVEERGGPNKDTMSLIERDVHKPHPQTLGRIAKALDISVSSLRFELESAERPLGDAPPSPQLPPNGALEEERRATWEAAVAEGRRLRETGRNQVWKALSEWSASKRREEPYAARRKYLDAIGDLLQEVYEAGGALGWAYIQAASSTPGGSDASVPSYLREESRKMDHFYGKLFELVTSSGLSVRTGDDAAAAKRAAAAPPEATSHSVQEAG
jgi:transcriptional regulator with XRE-family HTH domain